ncbi:hypothetical protein [Microbacterium sp.]|uniref:hypothetical protein n=1 Tax=Microbacterium sp. TaxID=51671 RepID=UPI003A8C5553
MTNDNTPVFDAPTGDSSDLPGTGADPGLVSHDGAAATPDPSVAGETGADATADAPPQYGVGPFSVREVVLAGIWLVAFVVSFFPLYVGGDAPSVWTGGIDWILTIAVPTAAVFLLVLRRLSPDGIRRVGSLGIDQFASVAFSVAAVVWLGIVWRALGAIAVTGVFVISWVVWVELILMLAGVFFTVLAPLVPVIGEDFRYRPEVTAHRNARPARPVVSRPAPQRPEPQSAAPAEHQVWSTGSFASTVPEPATDAVAEPPVESETAQDHPREVAAPAVTQAFWALVPEFRDVVDLEGTPLFSIGPTAWALVIEDRVDHFIVRHEDGRTGYLRDISDVTRG